MFQFLSLPFRNILRNRRRTLVTLFTLIIGVCAMLVFGGYANAVVEGVETGTVRQLGHLQIQRRNYFLLGTGSPVDYGIADFRKVMALVQEDPQLRSDLRVVTPMLQMQAIAGNFQEGVSQAVEGYGVVVADQNRLRTWNEFGFPDFTIKPVPLPAEEPGAVSIGVGVARILRMEEALGLPRTVSGPVKSKVKEGTAAPEDLARLVDLNAGAKSGAAPRNAVDLLAATATGAPNVVNVRVAAAESLGVKEIDDRYLALHLPVAQRLVYGQDEPAVTSIVLQLHSSTRMAAVRARLDQLIREQGWDLEVQDFATLMPAFAQIRGLFASIFGFIALLIGAIVLFSVANIMSSAVMERTVEIGTLRAMGMRRRGIASLFLMEGLMVGALGTGLGCLAAVAVALAINGAGLTWTPPNSIDKIPLVVHLLSAPGLMIGTVAGLTGLAMLSALLPARRASRIPVVDALRHV